MTTAAMQVDLEQVERFVARWKGVPASELSVAQTFTLDLCDLLGVARPYPTPDQAYMFERPVVFRHGDGTTSSGRIDCYKRGHFVLESKKVKAGAHTKGFDDALLRARSQGEGYARALPADEGRPPFVVVVDVGHVIELYAEFTRSGGTYIPFPDPNSHRIRLDDLRQPDVLDRLHKLWTDPLALDPARANARVTRAVSVELAKVARSLEADGHTAHNVAAFLSRCLFSMFAEDVGLLPETASGDGAFTDVLKRYREDPATLQRMMAAMWSDMDRGGFSPALAKDVRRFNGKLFKQPNADGYALRLKPDQIDGLLAAARSSWREVEPSIFGTLLERALDPSERHALGAHYTPRAYVERLVMPTVVEPLRSEWADAQAAALLLASEANALEGKQRADKLAEARAEVRRFHHRLCTVRVLDPACGSGNFLYVTLEHLKRLEGEVMNQLDALGDTQSKLVMEGETVTLQQLRGIELNEHAAALAELVLWIGFLQWHIRTFGDANVAEPVVHDYGNIECRDAVLAFDGVAPLTSRTGALVTRWDGVTFKPHQITGEPVPDLSAQRTQYRYLNPRKAEWPATDFIVGNPPFIGNKRMRDALGDGYADALRAAWSEVPESADFVMYWWHKAADTVRTGRALQFGLITTNSLTMIFNRRVVEAQQSASPPITLAFAIPDHPWVDSSDGAAVRIAMTVGVAGNCDGRLQTVIEESETDNGEVAVRFEVRQGSIHSNLKIGANVSGSRRLIANSGMSHMGVILVGAGFVVEPNDPLLESEPGPIKRYMNGRDLTQRPRGLFIIDLAGMTEDQVRSQYPRCYQRLFDRVRPERSASKDPYLRDNWWLFRRTNAQLRNGLAGLKRYIGTTETAKHRTFSFISGDYLPDQKIRVITSDDALHLGVLSSSVHLHWALATGGTLEDRPVYNNTTCFETFPFPGDDTGLTATQVDRIRMLAEQIDAHRKSRQAAHTEVTLTGLYNVLETLRVGKPVTAKDKVIYELGLVGVLQALHQELDAAVLAAYGWADLSLPADTDALLHRLVALNSRRANEETAGNVRWLRPDFQTRALMAAQVEIDVGTNNVELAAPTPASVPIERKSWPSGLPEQIKAVATVLTASAQPLGLDGIAAHFRARGRWRDRLPTILETLEAVGRVRKVEADRWASTNS